MSDDITAKDKMLERRIKDGIALGLDFIICNMRLYDPDGKIYNELIKIRKRYKTPRSIERERIKAKIEVLRRVDCQFTADPIYEEISRLEAELKEGE